MGAAWPRKKKQMALYFEKPTYEKLKVLKDKKHLNISSFVRDAVEVALKKLEAKEARGAA